MERLYLEFRRRIKTQGSLPRKPPCRLAGLTLGRLDPVAIGALIALAWARRPWTLAPGIQWYCS